VRDSITGIWSDIGDKRAIEKTSQALREGQPLLRRKIQSFTSIQLASKQQKMLHRTISAYEAASPLAKSTSLFLLRAKIEAKKSKKSLSHSDMRNSLAGMSINGGETMEMMPAETGPTQNDSRESGEIRIDNAHQIYDKEHGITDREIDDLIIQTFAQPNSKHLASLAHTPADMEFTHGRAKEKLSNDYIIYRQAPDFNHQDTSKVLQMETMPSIEDAANSSQNFFMFPKERTTHQTFSTRESEYVKLTKTALKKATEEMTICMKKNPPVFFNSKQNYSWKTETMSKNEKSNPAA